MTAFSTDNIMTYCLAMKDEKIQEGTARFIDSLLKCYKTEKKLPPLQILCLQYMGMIRKPRVYKP